VVIVIQLPPIRRYACEAEDVQRYNNIRNEVQSHVEDSGDSRLDSEILGQFFGLETCVPVIEGWFEKGEGSVWVGGIRMNEDDYLVSRSCNANSV
jgi:hypothetical protein